MEYIQTNSWSDGIKFNYTYVEGNNHCIIKS